MELLPRSSLRILALGCFFSETKCLSILSSSVTRGHIREDGDSAPAFMYHLASQGTEQFTNVTSSVLGSKARLPSPHPSKLQTYNQINNHCLKLLALGWLVMRHSVTAADPCEQLALSTVWETPLCVFDIKCFPHSLTLKHHEGIRGCSWGSWEMLLGVLGSHGLSSRTQQPFQPIRWSWLNLMLGVVATSTAVGSRVGAR